MRVEALLISTPPENFAYAAAQRWLRPARLKRRAALLSSSRPKGHEYGAALGHAELHIPVNELASEPRRVRVVREAPATAPPALRARRTAPFSAARRGGVRARQLTSLVAS